MNRAHSMLILVVLMTMTLAAQQSPQSAPPLAQQTQSAAPVQNQQVSTASQVSAAVQQPTQTATPAQSQATTPPPQQTPAQASAPVQTEQTPPAPPQETGTPSGVPVQPQSEPAPAAQQPATATQPAATQSSGAAQSTQTGTVQSQQAAPQPPSQPTPRATQPNVPTSELPEAAQQLPQSDRAELARIQREMDIIEQKKEMADLRRKSDARLRESRDVLKELLSGKLRISNALLQQSKCVVVVPSVKKFAVGFGARYGRGVMTCRLGDSFNGTWSAPSMYAMEGGNFGLQIGLQATDLVLLIMNDRGAEGVLTSKTRLGGDASLAAGPFGRTMEASTDLTMRAKILAYSRARGLFAGIALDGSSIRPDNRANEALYGREVSARDIVRAGAVSAPASALPFLRLLETSTHVAAETKAPGEEQH